VQPAVALQHLTGTSQPAPVAVPPGAQTLAAQLAPSVLTLAASAPGEHVLTIRVAPENLGPVTVQAHIGADGVRIELFSPTDAGRAAMHAVLADLRRDLAGTGIGASLDLSDRGAPAQDPTAREGTGHGGAHGQRSEASGPVLRTAPDVPRPERTTPLTSPTPVRLDVFV
jgi:flagellar hook-length control protein FliK